MSITPGMVESADAAYRRMAAEARYRPNAPSDGLGNITGPGNLTREAAHYGQTFAADEAEMVWHLGCPDHRDRAALVFIVEAARTMNGMAHEVTADLLRMALAEVEARQQDRR
jgi:hypothetical protein